MNGIAHEKVNAGHLKRNAYLYIRQSTLRQVFENTESTIRQYDLRQRAVALGWPIERVIVIDSDLGQSAATAADREGFQRLVTEVSLEKAGIVAGRGCVFGAAPSLHCDQACIQAVMPRRKNNASPSPWTACSEQRVASRRSCSYCSVRSGGAIG